MHTYIARVLDKISNPPNEDRPTWNSIKIGVFRVEDEKEEQIGEYLRNYPMLFNTFFYFRKGDKEYALYSPDYTATRILELPTCKDIGGEEPHKLGFCPTDYYIPSYIYHVFEFHDDKPIESRIYEPRPEDLLAKMVKSYTTGEKEASERLVQPLTPHLYHPFGFVAGCIWGDDSSWKIQYLDLSEADKGIVTREERFGYIVLPEKLRLKEAINMMDYSESASLEDADSDFLITITKRFNARTGKLLD